MKNEDRTGEERTQKTYKIKIAKANNVVESATLLFCIIQLLGSNLNQEIAFPEQAFSRFPSVHSDTRTILEL
jgi:hypothetical protein